MTNKTTPTIHSISINSILKSPPQHRTCGPCTRCCEGWLSGTVHDHDFGQGNPCHFLDHTSCSIYSDRPQDPCKSYQCEWLRNPQIPQWMRPDTANAIITLRYINKTQYLEIRETGTKLDSKVLNWFFRQFIQGNITNMAWQIDGGWFWAGSPEWCEEFSTIPKL